MNAGCRDALILLVVLAPAAFAAPSATELTARMREARLTPGFEARVQAMNVSSNDQRSEPIKLAVVGQFDAARGRLLIRGIAPEAIRNENRFAEYRADCVRVLDRNGAINPHAPLFGTALVAWDLLAPWWEWPRQSLAGGEEAHPHRRRHDHRSGNLQRRRALRGSDRRLRSARRTTDDMPVAKPICRVWRP